MSTPAQRMTLGEVLTALEHEGLLDPGTRRSAAPDRAEPDSPWFVRMMVGFGAWLAALLLIAFVVGVSELASEGGLLVWGIAFIVGGLLLRRRFHGDFVRQLALASSLAGQGLLAAGVMSLVVGEGGFKAALAVLLTVNALMIWLYPDDTHRLLSTVGVVACTTLLIYAFRVEQLIPFVGPLAVALLIVLCREEARFAPGGRTVALSAVRAGLLVSAFGCLMLSTVYLLPVSDDFRFYPRPWVSTLLLGALLLWLERDFIAGIFSPSGPGRRLVVCVLTVVVVAAAWYAPGIVLAIVVLVLGGVIGSALYRGAAIVFLALFLGAWFYGMEIGMLAKSATLVTLGLVVLGCRWLFAQSFTGPARQGIGAAPLVGPRAATEKPDA